MLAFLCAILAACDALRAPAHRRTHRRTHRTAPLRAAPDELVPAAISLAAGCLGGSIGVGVAYPLDTIKVKIQTYNSRALADGGGAPRKRNVIRSVLDEEGVSAFYAGVLPTMAGQALIKGVVFLVYDSAKRFFAPAACGLTSCGVGLALAACASGAAGGFVCTPVERLKVVMQAGYSGGPLACFRDIIAQDGVSGLLTRGLGATLAREIPAYFFYFSAYEVVSGALAGSVPAALIPLIGGAAAGAASWVPVYPIDVVKTAVQSETGAAGDGAGALDVARALYRQGGVGVFWDGISPKLARAVVNHAVTFLVFEQTCSLWLAAGV